MQMANVIRILLLLVWISFVSASAQLPLRYQGVNKILIWGDSSSFLTDIKARGSLWINNFTLGSIPFAGTGGLFTQNNAQFFWDNTNNRLGIGTATPDSQLAVNLGASFGGSKLKIGRGGNITQYTGFLPSNGDLLLGSNAVGAFVLGGL